MRSNVSLTPPYSCGTNGSVITIYMLTINKIKSTINILTFLTFTAAILNDDIIFSRGTWVKVQNFQNPEF